MRPEAGDESHDLVPMQPPAPESRDLVIEQDEAPAALATIGTVPARPGPRRALLLAAVGGTTLAVAYAFAPTSDTGDLDLRAPTPGRAARPARPKNKPIALATPARAPVPVQPEGDPFVSVSFVPPPPPTPPAPPPPPPAPPPVPKAPPLPFSFVGLLEKGGPKPAAFLARGDALLVVSAGDIVDNDYRIDSLSAREIVVTYLPLNERQSLTATGGRQ